MSKTLGQILCEENIKGNDFAMPWHRLFDVTKQKFESLAQAVADHVRGESSERIAQLESQLMDITKRFEDRRKANETLKARITQLEKDNQTLSAAEFRQREKSAPQFKFKVGDVVYDLDQDSNSICKLVVNSVMVDKHGVAYLFEGHSGSALESDCLTEEQAIEWIKSKSAQPTAII